MATRHNRCVNPALGADDSGWGGEAPPARVAVTGFGRAWAAQYTTGTYLRTAPGAVTPGRTYTLSVYVRPSNSWSTGGNTYIEWHDQFGAVLGYTGGTYTITDQVVSRASYTAAAPDNAATAQLILDGVNYSVTVVDATMVLIEETAALLGYFDGDTPGATWDGAPGSSPSTLSDSVTITGALDGSLPPLAAAATGAATVSAALAGTLPGVTAAGLGTVKASGPLAAGLPPLAMSAAGDVTAAGPLAAHLPQLAASLAGAARTAGSLTGALPALAGTLAGQVHAVPRGPLVGVLAALTAALSGTSDAADLDLDLVVSSPLLAWPVGVPTLTWAVGPPELGGE
ncbi:hypothetical protein AB0L05_27740 [Nonomuraea pusilla]|uniref:hypothetical protein n=1 Tax=Nonomuraea pusilla TaxID=46177 RepID=UPI00331B03DC